MIVTLLLGFALQTPEPAAVPAKAKAERKICKAIDATGSRLGGARECHTAAEWKALQGDVDGRDLNALNNTKGMNAGDYSKP